MKNAIVNKLDNGFIKIIPKKGYAIKNLFTDNYYSEVIVDTKKQSHFVAIKK